MRPGCQVREDLGLATSSLTPEKPARVEPFEGAAGQGHSSNVLGPPVVITLLVIATQIQLIIDDVALLQWIERTVQVFLFEGQLDHAKMLHNLRKIMYLQLFFNALEHNCVHYLFNQVHSLLFVADVRSDRAMPQFLH